MQAGLANVVFTRKHQPEELTLVETGDAEVAATAAVLRDAEAAVARARDARNTAIRVAVETRELTSYAAAKAAGISPQAVAQILGRVA